MNTDNTWRYTILGAILTVVAGLIVFQLIRIQTGAQAEMIRKNSDENTYEQRSITPPRGQIYDRWGNLLAGNNTVYEVGAELAYVENPVTIAMALNAVVGSDYDEVFRAASLISSKKSVYVVLVDFVTQEQKNRLERFISDMDEAYKDKREEDRPSLAGLRFIPHLQRYYPEKDLASNLLGFVSREGRGYFGVEEKYDDVLAHHEEKVTISLNPNDAEKLPEIPPGADLILTIDRAIQSEVQDILDRTLKESGAEAGSIIVMDPKSGEILAMVTTPRINLNEYWLYNKVFQDDTPYNRAISESYEPGSVFKVLTMASALDNKAVKPNTAFLDTGSFEIGGVYIRNWDGGAWGPQDMLGCMQHSLNVCLAWVASKLGANQFYNYLQRFGIGRLTGIDLAGEVSGRLKVPGDGDWYEADLGTNAFGQGVAVTPIQMVMAVSALANEGKMVAPIIVRSIVDNGKQYNTPSRIAGQPISAETAQMISEMLATSLEVESSAALIEGYRVAGKTGTAEIPTPYGYTSSVTNASFVGWGPVDDPRFLVYIWLAKPKSSPWGSVVAAPVFKQVVERLVVLINLPPDDVRHKWMDSQ